ncbi:RNA-guided endonuclease TnpB family protein [Spirosoma montaniterrae]|uniref:RNA-guided endonuclease TnpB family protein n=1 Tax=Spirosoma montaniterrae TaxID=1178516 RepID=UPI00097D4996|nr:RNA-guided endonuclease TnpB family protein [Spirosoma montaniterrae]
MLRAYRYCILPDDQQKSQLAQMFGCTRFVYNLGLETKISAYKQYGKTLNYFELNKQLTDLKAGTQWLSDCPSQALQMALRNLDNAYTAFFKGAGFPKFKSKRGKQSFQLPQGVKVDLENGKVFLPKLKWVDCVFSRAFTGNIKTVTVSRVPSGKHYISFLIDTQQSKPIRQPISRDTAVGIDLGVKTFATLSDGQVLANHKFLGKSLNRLRVEQRTLARRFKKGRSGDPAKEQSKNWHKQKLVVAKLHETITNQRRDFLHKASTQIIKEYDTVCLETLNTSGMMQNRKLSRAIGEMGWAEFNQMLDYKADWYGKNILRIGRFAPSSRICSICGWHNKALTLSDRVWTCANGHTVERDQNAALNILDFGLRTQPLLGNVRQVA